MTKDEIIKLAREAGIEVHPRKNEIRLGFDALAGIDTTKQIETFAIACYEAGRTAEKQECKRVCELEINRLSAIGEHRAALAVGICSTKIDERGEP